MSFSSLFLLWASLVKYNGECDHPATPRTRAIIHVGLHKTGSTSIQQASEFYSKQIQQDGYDIPWMIDSLRTDPQKLASDSSDYSLENREFASCFLPLVTGEAKFFPCDYNLLLAGSTIASKQRNLLVSAENFSVLGLVKSDGIERLQAYLSQWDDVTIVVYYRHYYSWIASLYNQKTKNKSIKRGTYKSVQDFIATEMNSFTNKYAVKLVERLGAKFDDIIVMNMHDPSKGSPAESFFCHSVPHFSHTCDAIRRSKKEAFHLNSSVKLDPVHLVAGAIKAGLLTKDQASDASIQNSVQEKIQAIQSKGVKMKRNCLSPEVLNNLWEKSLDYKRMLFPHGISSKPDDISLEEEKMKSEFDVIANTSFCMVDVDDALSRQDWQDFFKSISLLLDKSKL